MATLVLGAVGTLFGGPLGGAIGSLVGSQIDRAVLGGGTVKGPRLGDLAVQTSSYGSLIPRVYGTMRVAGTVIWATDLKETRRTSGGSKGQPGITSYSYSASLVVALSSRPARAVRRIWADGKLIRDEAGRFTVGTRFRFHPGSESQDIDPLIASSEGLGQTPAYRGLAVAVFEDLQLAEFGNRIPLLSFELECDAEAPTLAELLGDASGGVIECSAAPIIAGYAAHGGDRRLAIAPLVEAFGVTLVEEDGKLSSPGETAVVDIVDEVLGCSSEGAREPRVERQQAGAIDLPARLTMNFYETARDYQSGQTHASAGSAGRRTDIIDLPAVMETGAARLLTEQALARRWTERERATLWLPPRFIFLRAGSLLRFAGDDGLWRVEQVTLERLVVIAECRRATGELSPQLPADSGRSVTSTAAIPQPTQLVLFEVPLPDIAATGKPMLLIAAASTAETWRAVPLEVSHGGGLESIRSAGEAASLGEALTALGPGQSLLIDHAHSFDVQLANHGIWLESRDDDALVRGDNLAVLGDELLQFGRAEPLGQGRWRLSKLLRGRAGTEWAMGSHLAGERFSLLDESSVVAHALPASSIGSVVSVRPYGLADGEDPGGVEWTVTGESLRPPPPVHVTVSEEGGGLRIRWVRRSRQGWSWLDGVDTPLGESAERYRVAVSTAANSLIVDTGTADTLLSAADMTALGSGQLTIAVAQIGDFATSHDTIVHYP